MNATTKAIIDRLPKKPLLAPGDISAAYGLATTQAIIADIKVGRLAANIINGRYLIAREEAARYIEANEFEPDEGEL